MYVIAENTGNRFRLDPEAFAEFSPYQWRENNYHHAYRNVGSTCVSLHCEVWRLFHGPPKGQITFIGDRYDCRISNLIQKSHSQISRGLPGQGCSYRGVRRHRDRWQAYLTIGGREVYLGRYADELTAAMARDYAARLVDHANYRLNLPGVEPPDGVKERVENCVACIREMANSGA